MTQYHLRTVFLQHGPHRHLTDRCAFHTMTILLQEIVRRREMRTFRRILLQIQSLPKNSEFPGTGMASQGMKHLRIRMLPGADLVLLQGRPLHQLRCLISQSFRFRHLRPTRRGRSGQERLRGSVSASRPGQTSWEKASR